MSKALLSERDRLRLLYQEIIEGCSPTDGNTYIKHLCELEQIEISRQRSNFVKKYIAQGIPTEAERLQRVKEAGEWSDTLDGDVSAYRQTIADNEKMLPTIIPIQQPLIQKVIDQNKKELLQLIIRKRLAIGTTAEDLADRDNSYLTGCMAFYTDKSCDQRVFQRWEDFESLSEHEQEKFHSMLHDTLIQFTDLNIRIISALPFFLNPFSYSKDNIHTFLNRPVCRMTSYQTHLFSLGARNLNVLAQSEGSPPEYFDATPAEELIKWYDQQFSIITGKRKLANNS